MNVSQRRVLLVDQLRHLAEHLRDAAQRLESARSFEDAKGVQPKLLAVNQDLERCRRNVSDMLRYSADAERRGHAPLS